MGRKRPCIRDKLEDKCALLFLPVGVRIHLLPSLNPFLPPTPTPNTYTHMPLSQSSVSPPRHPQPHKESSLSTQDLHLCSSRAPCCSHKPGCSPVGAHGAPASARPACAALHHGHAGERFPSHVGTSCIPPPALGLEPDPGSPAPPPPGPSVPRGWGLPYRHWANLIKCLPECFGTPLGVRWVECEALSL